MQEDNGTATLTVRVLSGVLGKEVTVEFTTLSSSAISKSLRRIFDMENNLHSITVSILILTKGAIVYGLFSLLHSSR